MISRVLQGDEVVSLQSWWAPAELAAEAGKASSNETAPPQRTNASRPPSSAPGAVPGKMPGERDRRGAGAGWMTPSLVR